MSNDDVAVNAAARRTVSHPSIQIGSTDDDGGVDGNGSEDEPELDALLSVVRAAVSAAAAAMDAADDAELCAGDGEQDESKGGNAVARARHRCAVGLHFAFVDVGTLRRRLHHGASVHAHRASARSPRSAASAHQHRHHYRTLPDSPSLCNARDGTDLRPKVDGGSPIGLQRAVERGSVMGSVLSLILVAERKSASISHCAAAADGADDDAWYQDLSSPTTVKPTTRV